MTVLDDDTPSGPPAVKFKNSQPGAYVIIGIANIEQRHATDYDTGTGMYWVNRKPTPLENPNGEQPVEYPVITGIVVAANDVEVGPQDEERQVTPGELVTIHCQGGRVYAYRDAKRAHGKVSLGDVLRWKFDSTEPARNSRHQDRKIFTCEIRSPKAEDGDLMQRCEAAYAELKARPTLDEPAPAPAAAAASDAIADPF